MIHTALDVVLDLRHRFTIATERIDRITVTLDANSALPLVYDWPKDELQAKFSLHFAVAAALVDGAARLKQFSAERIRNPKIRNLMKRVEFIRAEVRKLTVGKGVNVVYDSVGKDTYEKSLESLAPLGALVIFGQASGPVPPFDTAVRALARW